MMRTLSQIQSNESLGDRSRFPDELKGEIAKDLWEDITFKYGMEYGYILALLDKASDEEPIIKEREW